MHEERAKGPLGLRPRISISILGRPSALRKWIILMSVFGLCSRSRLGLGLGFTSAAELIKGAFSLSRSRIGGRQKDNFEAFCCPFPFYFMRGEHFSLQSSVIMLPFSSEIIGTCNTSLSVAFRGRRFGLLFLSSFFLITDRRSVVRT